MEDAVLCKNFPDPSQGKAFYLIFILFIIYLFSHKIVSKGEKLFKQKCMLGINVCHLQEQAVILS
jgi:hypothetical protein